MKLSDKEWKVFFISKIFPATKRGKRLKKEDHILGVIPYVSSSALNNGIDGFIGNENKVRKYKNCLSLANSGSVGSCFYEPFEFIASDHVTHLKGNYTASQYLFMASMLNRLSEKYNFNREINDERIVREKIFLPVDDDGKPDFDFMEQYIKSIWNNKKYNYMGYVKNNLEKLTYKKIPELEEKKWEVFSIGDLYTISSGLALTKENMQEGTKPFIGASANNNGLTNFVSNTNKSEDKNVVSINFNGSVGEAFYHPYKCIFSSDVKRLHLKNYIDNEYVNLFIITSIKNQKNKYSYGYKFSEKRMKRQLVLLPVDASCNPDYEYMEQYIKNLMIKKYKDYKTFILT